MERQKLNNVAVLFTNAGSIGFPTGLFDVALCGFMGWSECFDYDRLEFTQPDTKATEIWRVLKDGGRFVNCAWEAQEDLAWMEQVMLRHYPALLENPEYLQQRPIGAAYEKTQGYEIILGSAGFRRFEASTETAEFVSTDEEEWWRQMENIGWASLFKKIEMDGAGKMQRIKEAIFKDLQPYKQSDGIHFTKTVLFVGGVK